MARASWTVDLPSAPHRIDVTYGYWFGRTSVRVDGRIILDVRPTLRMAFDRAVDLPFTVDGRDLIVMVRPDIRGPMMVVGYHFGLTVDGVAAEGTTPIAPAVRTAAIGRKFAESMAWAAGGGGVVALSQSGTNPIAIAYLLAPAACAVLIRRSTLSTRWLAVACIGILAARIVAVVWLGAVLKR